MRIASCSKYLIILMSIVVRIYMSRWTNIFVLYTAYIRVITCFQPNNCFKIKTSPTKGLWLLSASVQNVRFSLTSTRKVVIRINSKQIRQ